MPPCGVRLCAADLSAVYSMRMPRVNIWLPEQLHAEAKAMELSLSELTQQAVIRELDRRRRIKALDIYLKELDRELGPPSQKDTKEADDWIAGLKKPRARQRRAGGRKRTA